MDVKDDKGLARDYREGPIEADAKKDQPCLNCGAVLISKAQLDAAGHMSVNTLTQLEFRATDGEMYLKCPKCAARNFVDLDTGEDGLPQVKVTHVLAVVVSTIG